MEIEFNFWHWLIVGVVVLIFELVSGSGFLLWIGLAALVVSLVVFIVPSLLWPWQLVLFALMSVVTCVLWYKHLRTRRDSQPQDTLNKRSAQYIGRSFNLETILENGRGRVKIGDTIWRVSGDDMPNGTKVKVVDVDGVILVVEKDDS